MLQDTDFVALGADNAAWNVVRAEFDQLLLQHADDSGARVFDQTRVTELVFNSTHPAAKSSTPSSNPIIDGLLRPLLNRKVSAGSPSLRAVVEESAPSETAPTSKPAAPSSGRPFKAMYETATGGKGEIEFDYVVDASGRAGLMSTKYVRHVCQCLTS